MKDKLINCLFYTLLVFLSINLIWSSSKILNNIFTILFLLLSIIIIIYDIKKIKLDKIDIILILLPIFYLIPIIFKKNVNPVSLNIYKVSLEFSITLTLIVLRKHLSKEKVNSLLMTILTSSSISFFISFIYRKYSKSMIVMGINSYFGDTYLNSIDRFYGTLNYCNATALLFCIAIFISLYKINEEKQNRNIYMIFLFINFAGFLYTFSKMLTITFIIVLAVLLIYLLIRKKYINYKIIVLNILALVFPTLLSISAYRNFLINSNLTLFIFKLIILIIIYIALYNIYNYITKKFKYSLSIIFLLTTSIITFTTINPINIPLKINNVTQNNEYIISDFLLEKNKNYKIEFDMTGNDGGVKFELCKLYLDELIPTEAKIKAIDSNKNNIFEFLTDDNFEYYYLKVTNINKNTNITISNLTINNKSYPINTLIVPYQYIHQLDLLKYDKESVESRINYYKDSIKILKNNGFIIGHGVYSFDYYVRKMNVSYLESDPHSYLFQLLLDTGLYGGIYIILFIIIGIYNMLKKVNNNNLIIWFCIFSSCMIVLPFDSIYSILYLKVILMIAFIMICDIDYSD